MLGLSVLSEALYFHHCFLSETVKQIYRHRKWSVAAWQQKCQWICIYIIYIKWTVFVNVTKSAQHAHARMITIVVEKDKIHLCDHGFMAVIKTPIVSQSKQYSPWTTAVRYNVEGATILHDRYMWLRNCWAKLVNGRGVYLLSASAALTDYYKCFCWNEMNFATE